MPMPFASQHRHVARVLVLELQHDEAVVEVLLHQLLHLGSGELRAASADHREDDALPPLLVGLSDELLQALLDLLEGHPAVVLLVPGVLRHDAHAVEAERVRLHDEDPAAPLPVGDELAEQRSQSRELLRRPARRPDAHHCLAGHASVHARRDAADASVARETHSVQLEARSRCDAGRVLQQTLDEPHAVLLCVDVAFTAITSMSCDQRVYCAPCCWG